MEKKKKTTCKHLQVSGNITTDPRPSSPFCQARAAQIDHNAREAAAELGSRHDEAWSRWLDEPIETPWNMGSLGYDHGM